MRKLPHLSWSLTLAAALFLGGCQSPEKIKEREKKEDEAYSIRDDMKDTSLQAFVGRLRKAVAQRDTRTLSTMMTSNFAYSWAPGGEGFGCFQYWTENNLWAELAAVIQDDFVPMGGFVVAPAEFAEVGEEYGGFRAGIKREGGSFKFAYFVPPEDAELPASR